MARKHDDNIARSCRTFSGGGRGEWGEEARGNDISSSTRVLDHGSMRSWEHGRRQKLLEHARALWHESTKSPDRFAARPMGRRTKFDV